MRVPNRLILSFCAALLCVANAHAADKKLSRGHLPPPVQAAADEQAKGATVRGYSTETENGQKEYEVQLVVNGHSKDVTFAPDGRVMEIEEAVSMDALSPGVRSGLMAKAGEGKITKIESLTKAGKIVAYEAQLVTAGKHSEIQVGPDGKKLAHEE
jgi:hypothetical protein